MGDDPYAVLGVPRDVTPSALRAVYERLLKEAAAANALKWAAQIDAAYAVLNDPFRRELYDRTGTIVDVPRLPPAPPSIMTDQPSHAKPPRRGRRRRRPALVTTLILLVALSATAGLYEAGVLRPPANSITLAGDENAIRPAVLTAPVPTKHATHRTRLLPVVPEPAGTGTYAFLPQTDGGQVRWDPCSPIRYVVSGNEPFPGATAMLSSAIAEVSAATGLEFVYAGTTTETPSDFRNYYQPKRYGQRWAPVLVAWTDAKVYPRFAGKFDGFGGAVSVTVDGRPRLISGGVSFDSPKLAKIRHWPHGDTLVREVLLHELGHLVGLAHVKDKTQVMYPVGTPTAHYGVGDRRGLALLGAGPCPTSYY